MLDSTLPTTQRARSPWEGWETHIYPGLQIAAVPSDSRARLAQALGQAGVEAEFFLQLVKDFQASDQATLAAAENFLRNLEACGIRLLVTSADLEIATQGYLAALEEGFPTSGVAKDEDEPWWPAWTGEQAVETSVEWRLRACGYAYRHVVATRLSAILDGLADQLAFTLHALATLPPAGVAPIPSLYQGLYEISLAFQGDIAPQRIGDISPQYPGLMTSLVALRGLHEREDTSLASDITWAHAQLASTATKPLGLAARVRGWIGVSASSAQDDSPHAEWRRVAQTLEQMRASSGSR